jgi:hypothetical protein
MKEESRPIAGTLLGIVAGAVPLYWAFRELWGVWGASTTSSLVGSLVGSRTQVTTGVLSELKNWFAALTIVELLAVVFAVLLFLFPRRHLLWGGLMLVWAAVGLGLLYSFPFRIGMTELLTGLIIFPVLGFLGGVAGLLFRSDFEFARSYGLD